VKSIYEVIETASRENPGYVSGRSKLAYIGRQCRQNPGQAARTQQAGIYSRAGNLLVREPQPIYSRNPSSGRRQAAGRNPYMIEIQKSRQRTQWWQVPRESIDRIPGRHPGPKPSRQTQNPAVSIYIYMYRWYPYIYMGGISMQENQANPGSRICTHIYRLVTHI